MVMAVGDARPHYERPCGDIDDVDICTWTLDSGDSFDLGLPLGSTNIDYCSDQGIDLDYNTWWTVGSEDVPTFATATCVFEGSQLEEAMIYVSINNDVVECTLNDVAIISNYEHEGCAPEDPRDSESGLSEDIYSEVVEGENTLVCELQDRGYMSHFDACVVGDYDYDSPDVEVISPPDTPFTWLAGDILIEGTITETWPGSGIDYVETQIGDQFGNWYVGFFPMTYNGPYYEYLWDSTTAPEECSEANVKIRAFDMVGNEGSDTNKFGIDNEPPETTKDWTTPFIECASGSGCDLYVTTDTDFTLSATDCGIGVDETYYIINDGSTNIYDGEFSLDPGCFQTIEYWSEDLLGNEEEPQTEIDHVDNLPPTTEKTFDGNTIDKEEGDNYYLTTATNIILTATDHSPEDDACPVGIDYIYYEIWWDSDDDGVVDIMTESDTIYDDSVTVNFKEDSIHEIRWYAVDKLGNTEEEHIQEHAVDGSAPIMIKTVYEPKVDGSSFQADWFMTQNTKICINATDPEPHPVNDVTIMCEWSWRNGDQSGDQAPFELENGNCFTYTEDSLHELYCSATDALGNKAEFTELDVVDTQAPESWKRLGENNEECSGDVKTLVENEDCNYVTTVTPIWFTCTDPQPHPVGGEQIFYRQRWREDFDDEWDPWGEWDEYIEGPIFKEEESIHELEWYCIDELGNEEVHQYEIDIVDDTAPELTKEVGEPKYDCSNNDDACDLYVTQNTPITFTCTDMEPHPVNDVTIFVEAYWSEDGGDTYGIDPIHSWEENNYEFTLYNHEDSYHKFIYWCEDALGNPGEVYEEIDNVDTIGPEIIIHNPTEWETHKIKRCDQSVVVEVWDEKSGINESSVYAELYNESDDLVRTVQLEKAVYTGIELGGDIYEGLMDKQLPAGEYDLVVYASDNVDNLGEQSVTEYLQEGIYVEYIDADCEFNILEEGTCDFEFNICMRGGDSLKMWMDKLGEDPSLITPDMLEAGISSVYDEDDPSYVGLAHIYELFGYQIVDKISDAQELMLSGGKVNGKTTFDLSLTITPDIAGKIGIGTYDLEYYLESHNNVL